MESHETQHQLHTTEPYESMIHPTSNSEGEEVVSKPANGHEKGDFAALEAEISPGRSDELKREETTGKWNSFRRSKTSRIIRDAALILLLLGWWIPGIVRKETRHYWIITTIWTWFFILLILLHNSRYIPQKPFVRVISKTWNFCLSDPFFKLPYMGRLGLGWGAVAVLALGSAFGIKPTEQSPYKWRAVSLVGIIVLYSAVYLFSVNRSAVQARQIILGLSCQFILGLLVFKTGAGLSFVQWIALAASDFLEQGITGGATFFWRDFTENGYFFTNTLATIIFFVAFATALYYSGVMSWVLKKFAWFFSKTFDLSGAEAVVAAASPFIGQGENCILTKPYVKDFTDSEMHQALTSGFATIAGSVFIAYVNLGVPPKDLLTSSIMSIPASIALSKTMVPETGNPLTRGTGTDIMHKGEDEDDSANLLHSFSNGAWLGLKIAGLVFCNVLCIVSALYAVNGLLAWIGQFWGIDRSGSMSLSLELMGSYLLYPLTFLLGVPPADILQVSRLITTKIIANEFVAYDSLQTQLTANPTFISPRALLIARYALCGFGNIASAGINIGILVALAPNKSAMIVRLTPRALVTGVIATLSTACVAGLLGDSTSSSTA